MDATLLNRTELSHELTARGYKNVDARTVPEMRKILTRCLKSETVTGPPNLDSYEANPALEIDICAEKLNELKDLEILGAEQSLDFRRFTTKIAHVLGRLSRIKTEDENLLATLKTLRTDVITLEDQRLRAFDEGIVTVPDPTPEVAEPPRPKRKQIPVSQWGLTFSGDEDSTSVGAFLERVEEFRVSRNLTTEELFNSAVELMKGSALIWFRAIKTEIHSWEDFAIRIRREFEPYDYEYELWQEIRARTQGPTERVGSFFACMINLFTRLPHPPTEEEKLNILKRNMEPYFILHTGLIEVTTVEQLRDICRRLEANRFRATNSQPPPTNRRKLLEPDLACPMKARALTHAVETSRDTNPRNHSRCWNCNKIGHNYSACRSPRTKFCYTCGTPNCTKASCTKCNGQRQKN